MIFSISESMPSLHDISINDYQSFILKLITAIREYVSFSVMSGHFKGVFIYNVIICWGRGIQNGIFEIWIRKTQYDNDIIFGLDLIKYFTASSLTHFL